MKRIVVIGCGGSGKSILAKAVGELLDLPVHQRIPHRLLKRALARTVPHGSGQDSHQPTDDGPYIRVPVTRAEYGRAVQPDMVPIGWAEQLAAGRWLFERAGYPPNLSVELTTAEIPVGFWTAGRTPRDPPNG